MNIREKQKQEKKIQIIEAAARVFAENGFIYEVDRVVEPIMNIEQILYSEEYGQDHKYIKDLLRLFPKFASDLEETNKQPEAKEGREGLQGPAGHDRPRHPRTRHPHPKGP